MNIATLPTALTLRLLPCLICIMVTHSAAQDTRPWWENYHTLLSLSTQKEGQEWQLGIMAERGAWPTGWYGPWWIQHQLERRGRYDAIKHVEGFRERNIKNVFYFDVGEFGEFVALVDEGEISYNQWELCFYRGHPGQLAWFGKDGFYRDQNPFKLKNYRDFGLPPWTMPDGTRPESLYDFARTSLEGKRDPWDQSSVRVSPEIARQLDIDAFLASGPDPVPEKAKGSLGRICSYDHSNPFLLEDFKASVGGMLTLKPHFLHFDNYFDNQIIYPQWQAFGPWSIEMFRRFLKREVDPATLRDLGIDDPDSFDLKKYISQKPFESRGQPWHSHNKKWRDDPIWNLFVCSKLADSTRLFRDLYAYCKTESQKHGLEVQVVGNTIPIFPGGSLASGAIDMAHFEHHAAVQYGPLVTPTGLPPLGRLGGLVRLGAAVSRAGYCWPSVYVPQELSGPGHENLHKVMAMDCLANKGVLDYGHQYLKGYSPGSDESAAWANCYIKNFSSYYGSRTSLANVGVVFPGQSLLASVSVFTMDSEKCLHDYLGWAQALTDLHFQWDVLLDDQLNVERLGAFQVVVLPSVACLSDQQIAALVQYERNGGRLVASGPAGTRHGLKRFLWHRDPESTLAAQRKPHHASFTCPQPPGRSYYEDIADGRRSDGGPFIKQALDHCLADSTRLVTTNAPATVGLFSFREPDGTIALDLVNYDLDPPTDRLVPTDSVVVIVNPPPGRRFQSPRATLFSPDLRERTAGATAETSPTPWQYRNLRLTGRLRDDGSLELAIPEFTVFCTVSVPVKRGAGK